MVVYRIENKKGIGIFKGNNKYYKNCCLFLNTPKEDGIDMEIDDFCAFKRITQVYHHVPLEDLKSLIKIGFKIFKLTISKGKIGKDQICYKKEDIITKENITNLIL